MNDQATGSPPMVGACLSIDAWLTHVASYTFDRVTPTMLVLHHTWSPTVAQWQGLKSMQGMQRFYRLKGWSAAPHVYAAPDGIWLFTPLRAVGVHANAGNSGVKNGQPWYSIGLEMVGDYDKVRPSGAVWEHAKAVIGGLSMRVGIAPRNLIHYHREFNHEKTCPGLAVTPPWVIGEIDAWIAQRRGKSMPASGIQGAARVYTCSDAFSQFYAAHGGIVVFGYPTTDMYSASDAAGEVCNFMQFENCVMKFKPSEQPDWRMRLAPLAEVRALLR